MRIEFSTYARQGHAAIGIDTEINLATMRGESTLDLLTPAEQLSLLHRVSARMQEAAQEEIEVALRAALARSAP